MPDPSSNELPPTSGGIHISRGVTPRIPIGGLVIQIGSDGKPTTSARLELQLDTCIHWLEIAIENLTRAKTAHAALVSSRAAGVTDFGSLLDQGFKASVQASVAAATFFEALYAATLERMPVKPTSKGANRRQRPARYAMVTESVRQAFGLKKQGTANLRSVLREVYRFRDEAVHPSAKFTDPVMHPELGVGVERRFLMFGYESALQLVRAALAFSKIFASRDLSRRSKPIQEFAAYLLTVCEPLYQLWEQDFGQLLDPPQSAA